MSRICGEKGVNPYFPTFHRRQGYGKTEIRRGIASAYAVGHRHRGYAR